MGQSPALTDEDKQQISAHREAFVKAVREGNASAIASHFTYDAIYLPVGSHMIRGRAEIEKLFQRSGGMDYSVEPVEVSGSGGLAYEVGTFTVKSSRPGSTEPAFLTGKHVWVLRKQADGSWKSVADIANFDQPPTRTQPREPAPSSSKVN